METFRKTLRRDKAKYICTPYFGKDYPDPLKEDEILLEPLPPSNVPSVGEILDEILLESNRTKYQHDGSPIYMARLFGLKKAAQAIHDLIGEKKEINIGKIIHGELRKRGFTVSTIDCDEIAQVISQPPNQEEG
jgi:hypothetical protein